MHLLTVSEAAVAPPDVTVLLEVHLLSGFQPIS